ncbi:hypothetical protein ACIOBL_01480 [Paenibacillus taichungensis]|uniref:hypothetical protein n=1 Tax=Paenibacillus taichungensis TaxID=484184 RepID=UPI003811D612
MEVKLLKGVKYGREFHRAGDTIDVKSKDIPEMIKKKLIPEDTEVEAQDDDKPNRKRKKDAEAEGDADPTPEG